MASTLPESMRAVQFSSTTNGIEKNLHLNAAAPLPSSATSLPQNHTLVKVAYTTLNPVDYKIFESPAGLFFPKPRTTCMDFSGTVVSTSRSDLRPGQRVFGKTEPPAFGALAEYLVVGPQGCAAVPEGVELEQVSGAGVCGLTAYQCIVPYVEEGRGNRVLIIGGSGGTGTFGIQIAKALGCRVTAVCSGANAALCRSLGADAIIDYRSQNVIETLKATGGKEPFDLIVDNVGADLGIYYAAHEYLKPEGRYIIIAGLPTLKYMCELITMLVLPSWLGGGQRKVKLVSCAANAAQYSRIAGWMVEGKVRLVIDELIELENARHGFEKLKTGRTRGKIVVRVGAE